MEPADAISEGEWSSLSGLYNNEEADFMAQLLGHTPLTMEPGSGSGFGLWPAHDSTVSFVERDGSLSYPSNSYSHPGVIFSALSGCKSGYLNLNDTTNPGLETVDGAITIESALIGEHGFLNNDIAENNVVRLKDEGEEADMKKCSTLESSRKRSRSAGTNMKKNQKLKKSPSLEFSRESHEDENAVTDSKSNAWQNSSACSSEDDSSISQGQNGGSGSITKEPGTLNLSGKARASRGSATDPQSLYARKRRERINERLKILQNLVPNGTKVDISTMLEEAVHYVKFLQLQIKLLSSNDMWMYAPIAYNGIDIGLNLNINSLR